MADLSFHKRHLIHFLVIDRPVPEVPFLTEQLSVIRRDSNIRVRRDAIE